MDRTHPATVLDTSAASIAFIPGASYYTVCLAGNPNTGKSTVFNALTGLNQHTGNWPGKTVAQARGFYEYAGKSFSLVDLPGTYSLLASSPEEEIARDFLCSKQLDATVIVVDATCLERNLNLVLQVMEITSQVVVCLNLMDEAQRKGLNIDRVWLADQLGVPVIPTAANTGRGLSALREQIYRVASRQVTCKPLLVEYPQPVEQAVRELDKELAKAGVNGPNRRWVALRLLENDPTVRRLLAKVVDQK